MADRTSYEAAAHQTGALPVTLAGKLIGREPQLAQVYSQLKLNRPVQVYGVPGIGKTALAATLAGAYTELPGGALWLNVNNSSFEELLVRVGRAYGVAEITTSETPAGMVGAVASTLTSSKPLIVLDGQHDAAATTQFVTRCADGLPVLVVSKDRIEGIPTGLELGKLAPEAAATLFRQAAGLDASANAEDIDELVSILDYIPFAIMVAAGTMRAAKQTPADYLAAFEKIPSSAGASPQLLALTIAFRSLNNALQGVMLLMGATFTGAATAELLSMMGNAPVESIQGAMNLLGYLVERGSRYEYPFYRLHEITHTFAQSWLRGSNRLDMLQAKVRDTVAAYAKKYSVDTDEAHNKLAAEMDNIMSVARWSAERGDRDVVKDLVLSLTQAGDFVRDRGYIYELLTLNRLAASFTQAFPLDAPTVPAPEPVAATTAAAPAAAPARPGAAALPFDDVDEDEADDEEGEEDTLIDEDDDLDDELDDEVDEDEDEDADAGDEDEDEDDELSALQAELRQAKQQNDQEKQVELLKDIGDEQVDRGMENEAITTYTELLAGYEALDDQEGILETLDTLSSLMVKTDNASAAVLHATRGISLADTIGDPEAKMHMQITLGDARQQSGESEEAVKSFESALEIARGEGDSQNEARILYKLGYAQLDSGDPGTAADTWEQALKLFRAQGKRNYEGRVLGGLGTAYGELGRWAEAINFHTSALHIAREVGDKEDEALELGNLGYASVQANQLGQAVLRYRQALHLAYEADDRENIVSTIVDLVRLLSESPRHLDIAELLINDALALEPADRDVTKLKERVANEKALAKANGIEMKPTNGTAKDYAENAYKQLEG
jgi:tetratricopeptide (TPR) repeat protein/energy-coupling factor transporter ATP-binding protein EcfA2